jgi:hypothetical protein
VEIERNVVSYRAVAGKRSKGRELLITMSTGIRRFFFTGNLPLAKSKKFLATHYDSKER